MRQRETAEGELRGKGLDFHKRIHIAACRIAVVADGGMAAKLLHLRGIGSEILADMAKRAVRVEGLPIIGDDAGGFLSAMLKRVKPERCENTGLVASENTENTTFFVERIEGINAHPGAGVTACHCRKPAK